MKNTEKFLHYFRNRRKFCKLDKLRQGEESIKEEMIEIQLIKVIDNAYHKSKMCKELELANISLDTYIDFIRQQELISCFNNVDISNEIVPNVSISIIHITRIKNNF